MKTSKSVKSHSTLRRPQKLDFWSNFWGPLHDAIKSGIGFLTKNRKDEGLILDESIRENISLPSIDGFNKNLVVDRKAEHEFTDMLGKRLGVLMSELNEKFIS
jgi:ABC-type sugar transport system ATPase subunit